VVPFLRLWAADETVLFGLPKLKFRFNAWSPISTESEVG
jgi:hypothetical protein